MRRFPLPCSRVRIQHGPQRLSRRAVRALLAFATIGAIGGCGGDGGTSGAGSIGAALGGAPDELPVLALREAPFRYPTELYAQRLQGNVMLRLFVDSLGGVVHDSTRVDQSSGHAALDSAALRGAASLRFRPARRDGTPVAVALLYPVYFRHPEAPPLPGDTILNRR